MKKALKTVLKVIIVCLIFGGVYMTYFFLIGIPKTQARTYYNLATLEIQRGNIDKARQDLNKALSYWKEGYIVKALDDLKYI